MKNSNYIIQSWQVIFSLIFILSIFLPSCNDDEFLKEVPQDFLSPSNSYSTPEGVEMGITALHSEVRNWFHYNKTDGGNATTYTLFALGTDEAFLGENPSTSGYMNNYITDCVPTSSYVSWYWDDGFSLIQHANVLIQSIDNIDEASWNDATDKNIAMGEALFFRAFAYRMLAALFGDVPLITEPVSSAKVDFIRTQKSEVYEQLESDLTFAAARLPERGNEAEPGRITQGAAWHLLSEIYLADEKYQEAVDAASHVINDYGYALMTERFGSQPNVFKNENVYFDLFTKENHNLSANTEAIWVIQFDPDVTGGGTNCGERAFGCRYYGVGNTPDGYKAILGELYEGSYTGYSDTLGRPVAWVSPTNYVKYDIWQDDWADERNAECNVKRNFYFDNPASVYDGQRIDWSLYAPGERTNPRQDTVQYIFPYFMKVAAPLDHYTIPQRSGGGFNHKDLYAFRLAETYLLRAEAYLGLGNTTMAAADINIVRNRANATPVTAGEVDVDYILDERARELYTEEMRMITLMRLGKLVERVQQYNNNPVFPGLNIQEHNNLWPIPQTEIDLNTGTELEQNPGYN